jgi:hypothetical protein
MWDVVPVSFTAVGQSHGAACVQVVPVPVGVT